MTDSYSAYHILSSSIHSGVLKKRMRILPAFIAMRPLAIRILGLD
jgi:hypothetical protein